MARLVTWRASSRRRTPVVERLEGRDLPASFVGLGSGTTAADVSANGSVVLGAEVNESYTVLTGFLWTAADGIARFPAAIQPFGGISQAAGSLSADGTKVVGLTKRTGEFRAASWSAATGLVDLGISYNNLIPDRLGISADGTIIAGSRPDPSRSADEVYGYYRNADGSMFSIDPGYAATRVLGISADGRYVVGSTVVLPDSDEFAFRWSVGTGLVDLGVLGFAASVSADGSTVVGGSDATGLPFAWDAAAGAVDLGLPAGMASGLADDVSGDGKLIVGTASLPTLGSRAIAWGADRQPIQIKDLLQSRYGLDLTGWTLSTATAVSADGTTIVGNGFGPSGRSEAWVASLATPPPPPNLVATKLAFAADGSGVRFEAELRDAPLAAPAPVGLYWARSDPFGHVTPIGPAISTVALTQIGSTGEVFVPRAAFASPPAGATGLVVIADPANAVAEGNELDNTLAMGLPNIQAQTAWDVLLIGAKARYHVAAGVVTAPTEMAIYWASGPNRGDILGSPIKTQVVRGNGDGEPIPLRASDVGTPPPGAHYLVAIVDPADLVLESDETDNVSALAVPDLAVTGLAYDPQGNVVYSGRVGTTRPPIFPGYLDLYFARGPGRGDVTQLIERQFINAPGDYGPFTLLASRLSGRTAVDTHLVLVADRDGLVQETDETNNVASLALTPLDATNFPGSGSPAKLSSAVATLRKATLTGLTLAFDRALGELSGTTITLVQAGRDRRFGTKDDVTIALGSPTASGGTLKLKLRKAARLVKVARLSVTGLRAADGSFVDANRDGVPDTSWSRTLTPNKKGKSISIS